MKEYQKTLDVLAEELNHKFPKLKKSEIQSIIFENIIEDFTIPTEYILNNSYCNNCKFCCEHCPDLTEDNICSNISPPKECKFFPYWENEQNRGIFLFPECESAYTIVFKYLCLQIQKKMRC